VLRAMTDRTIFVVDDDASARHGLARLIRVAGYEVRTAGSAREFLACLGPEPSGLVVLDARMPGMSGEELQQELIDRGVCLPLIFVTADDDPKTRRRAQQMMAAGFFRKPVDGIALLDAIAWALRPTDTGGEATAM